MLFRSAANDYLGAGLAENLITSLAALPKVTVLSRSAVEESRQQNPDRASFVKSLDASYVVTGSVQSVANQLRVTLNLERPDASVAWGETVEGPATQLFQLQTRLATALAQIATALAERADLTLVADEHVPPVLARNRMVLRNLADPALLPPLAAPSTQPHMVYIGDVRTSRGLKAMLAALEQAPAWTLDIVGRVDANDQQWLDTWQQTSPAATRLTMHGQLPPSIAWQHAQTAWVGLVLLQPTPAFVAAMPSKVYEYEACGLTVVTTNLPRQQAWLNSGGVGVSIPSGDDTAVASAVARALLAIQQDPGLVHQARERAAQVRNQSPYAQFAQAIAQLSQRG